MEYEPCLRNGNRPSVKKISGPDGWEAWRIACAACFINFIMGGLSRISGVLYVAFIDIYDIKRGDAALPYSIRSSVRNLLGPAVGILGQKYGIRKVIILGSIIGSISAAACFFVRDIWWMTIVWGIINGVGTAMTTTLPQVVIAQHFKKFHATASGIAVSGGCVGSILFPILLEYLLHLYGLNGTFLIISAIIMHTIPAGLILVKPSWLDKNSNRIEICSRNNRVTHSDADKHIDQSAESTLQTYEINVIKEDFASIGENKIVDNFDHSNERKTGGTLHNSVSNSSCDIDQERLVKIEFLRQNKALVIQIMMNELRDMYNSEGNVNIDLTPKEELERHVDQVFNEIENFQHIGISLITDKHISMNGVTHLESNKQAINGNGSYLKHELESNFIFKKETNAFIWQKLELLSKVNKNNLLKRFPNELHDIILNIIDELNHIYLLSNNHHTNCYLFCNKSSEFPREYPKNNNLENQSNTFVVHIKTAALLFTNLLFLLICICRTVHFLILMSVLTIIVDFSMDKGLQEEDGKFVISAFSSGDLIGRLGFGWITDRGLITLPRYMLLVMILQGVSYVSLAFVESRGTLMTALAIFGLLEGSSFVLHPVLLSKYTSSHENSIAMGCINLFSGLLGLTLPSYIGYFRDTIGSYNGIFYINGAVVASVGLLWISEPFLRKYSEKGKTEAETADV